MRRAPAGSRSAWVLLLLTAVVCAASAQRFNYEASCKQFETDRAEDDLSWLGAVQYVTVGNNRIAYRRISVGASPDATPLLLLMGYGGTMNAWGPTLLKRLAEKREVIVFDNLAQGLSEEIEPAEGPITPTMLEEARSRETEGCECTPVAEGLACTGRSCAATSTATAGLMLPQTPTLQATLGMYDALNLTRPHVAGWSLGACAALKLAALHPDRVSKVVSWSGTSPDGRAVTGSLSTMKTLFNPHNTDEDYAPLNWDLSTPSGLRGACFWMRDKHRMPLDDARPETNERYSQGIWQAIRPWDWSSWRALGRTPVPVLLMTGTEDIIVPANAATKLAGQIPGAWLAQFPSTGHGFLWERMDAALAVVETFLQAGTAHSEAASGSAGSGTGGGAAAGAAADREL